MKRDQNHVAHEIATYFRQAGNRAEWDSQVPSQIAHVIAKDCKSPSLDHE